MPHFCTCLPFGFRFLARLCGSSFGQDVITLVATGSSLPSLCTWRGEMNSTKRTDRRNSASHGERSPKEDYATTVAEQSTVS